MPTDRTVVGMLVESPIPARVVIQGDANGWRKVVRIDLGTELVADIPVPERSTDVLRVRELPGLELEEALAAVRAAFEELDNYEMTRAALASRRALLEGEAGRYVGAPDMSGVRAVASRTSGRKRLEAVANLYRYYVEGMGMTRYSAHLADAFGVSPQRAKELVAEARAAGLLGPATPGAAGEVRKPKPTKSTTAKSTPKRTTKSTSAKRSSRKEAK
jgi:hypothetical protein